MQGHFSSAALARGEIQSMTTTGFINGKYIRESLSCNFNIISFEIGEEKFLTIPKIEQSEQSIILFQSKQNPHNTISITHTYGKGLTLSTLMTLLDIHFNNLEINETIEVNPEITPNNNFRSTSIDLGSIITCISPPTISPLSGLWGIYICRYPNGYPHVDNPGEAKIGYHLTNGTAKTDKYFFDSSEVISSNGTTHRIIFDDGFEITVNLANLKAAKILRNYTYKDEYHFKIDTEYLGCEIFYIDKPHPLSFQIN